MDFIISLSVFHTARYAYFVSVSMPLLTFEQMDCMVSNWIEETYPALVLKKMRFRGKRNKF
jgi:hypothetical protein